MDLKSQKIAIRRQVSQRILGMDPADRTGQEIVLCQRFATLPGLETATTVLLYVTAFPEEISTRPMLSHILNTGKRLVLPRVDRPSKTLQLFEVQDLDRDLTAGHRGILEPSTDCPRVAPQSVDWVLVPGLAFDSQGFRLGRGAGHYDKLLPALRPEAPRWALILDTQWVEDLPIERHDQPLDGVADAFRSLRFDRHSMVTRGEDS